MAKNILIAPLDWGLGHTTRCIPVIKYIRQLGHNPIVAGNASQLDLITQYVPGVSTVLLEGYNVRYSEANRFLQSGLLSQLPGITRAIAREQQWLLRKAGELQLHGIISDNRYGLYHPTLTSVIITHQLRVMSGFGAVPDRMVQRMHYRMLNRFSGTWVADSAGPLNLAGDLSHPARLPHNTSYIGLLSRFADAAPAASQQGPLLILLSGPEPQRSVLAGILWQQAIAHNGRVVFAEGSDNAVAPVNIPPHITYYQRLLGDELTEHLANASTVVCRSGYSTLMDLVALGKRAIVIPTPGQTEQEYLGRSLNQQGIFYCAPQRGFDLQRSLAAATTFPFRILELQPTFTMHQQVVADWLRML